MFSTTLNKNAHKNKVIADIKKRKKLNYLFERVIFGRL